jgi:hypothetical protein
MEKVNNVPASVPVAAAAQVVQSNVIAADNSVAIRFVKVTGQKTPKSPKYRVLVSLIGGLAGLVLEGAIFQDEKTGGFAVMLPGASRFGNACKAAPRIINDAAGNEHLIPEADPDGIRVLDRWQAVILTAFHTFRTTEEKIAAHRVNFNG